MRPGCTGGSIRPDPQAQIMPDRCLHVCLQILKLLLNVPHPLPIAEIHETAEIPWIIYLRAELHCPSYSILSATRLIFCHPPSDIMGQPCVRRNLNQINCFQKNHRGHKSIDLCVNTMMTPFIDDSKPQQNLPKEDLKRPRWIKTQRLMCEWSNDGPIETQRNLRKEPMTKT